MPKQGGCCQCQPKKKGAGHLDKFQEHLLRATYVLCSCIIVYSLLMLNALAASDSKAKGESYLIRGPYGVQLSALPNPKEVWLETVFFMDRVGGNMGEPLKDTISLYSEALGKAFALTGSVLAKIPEILTSAPPYARAMGD